jgi:multicomponent Na+:H+ antiporter subunit F
MDAFLQVMLLVLVGAIGLTTVRLLAGPGLANRVVALDVIAVLAAAAAAVGAIAFDQPAFFDITIILAIISFVGTVAFAYYLEKRIS